MWHHHVSALRSGERAHLAFGTTGTTAHFNGSAMITAVQVLILYERYICTPAIGGVYKNATKPNNTQRDQTRVRVGSNNVQQRPMLPNVTQCLFKRPTLPNIIKYYPIISQ